MPVARTAHSAMYTVYCILYTVYCILYTVYTQTSLCSQGKREREKERTLNAQKPKRPNKRKREIGEKTGNGWGNQIRVKKLNAYMSVLFY
jgi:hypothetical protein